MFINYIYYNKQNNLDPDLVVLDQSKHQIIMSSSDSDSDYFSDDFPDDFSDDFSEEFTENFGLAPDEKPSDYWDRNGYGSDPDDNRSRSSSSSSSDSSDSEFNVRGFNARYFNRGDISPDLCPACLCERDGCDCAEQYKKHLKYLAKLRRNARLHKNARLRRNNVLHRRSRKKTHRNNRDAKCGGKSTQKRVLRAKPEVQPKQKKLAEPQVQPKQEGTTTSDHSYDHHLDQSDDDSHKTDIHENH